jgi:hypothetical protein
VLYHNAPGKLPDDGGLVAAVYTIALPDGTVTTNGLVGFLDHEFVAVVYVY